MEPRNSIGGHTKMMAVFIAAFISMLVPARAVNFWSFSVILSGGATQVVWPAVPSAQYLVEYATDVNFTTGVQQLSSPTISQLCGGCTDLTTTDTSTAGRRRLLTTTNFYRVTAMLANGTVISMSSPQQPQDTTAGSADFTDPGNYFVYPAPYGSTAGGCGTWTSPCSTIAAGITAAVYDGGFLWIGPGTYTGAGNNGLTFGTPELHVTSLAGARNTVIDMQGSGRAFSFTGAQTSSTTITGLTIQGGSVSSGGGGGAMLMTGDAGPIISYVTFNNNTAVSGQVGGGAVYITGTGVSAPSFIGCTFTQNVADSGGAIFVSTEGIVVEHCFFDSNSAVQNGGGRGGAMMTSGGVGLFMQNTWFQNNEASLDGGALHIEATMQLVDLTNITIINNHAKSFGGAVNEVSSNITFRSSTVNNNIADLYAGGIFSFFAGCYIFDTEIVGNTAVYGAGGLKALQGAILMWNTNVANNSAADGAGIQIDKSPGSGGDVPAYLQATDSIIQGNVATGTGGGIVAATCDQIVLTNVTFSNNIATKGGGIYFAGDDVAGSNGVGIIASLFTENNAQSGGAVYAGPGARGLVAYTTFDSNTAKSYGGALLADDDSQIQISNSAFTNNGRYSCYDPPMTGGAINVGIDEFKASSTAGCGSSSAVTVAQLQLVTCHFSNNLASSTGGAINMLSGALIMQIEHALLY
ncbi:probable metabotropic glutamate receptor-like protein P [Coccomyxa sp. Obi]|nr:probable metabotropic glutamate receptor-like protein P [Coccomyxa sp. Obi]